jgi:hypothetical protein
MMMDFKCEWSMIRMSNETRKRYILGANVRRLQTSAETVAQYAATSGKSGNFNFLNANEETSILSAHMVAQDAVNNGQSGAFYFLDANE